MVPQRSTGEVKGVLDKFWLGLAHRVLRGTAHCVWLHDTCGLWQGTGFISMKRTIALFQDLPPPINPSKRRHSTLDIQVLVADMGLGPVNSFADVLLACHQYVYEQNHNIRALKNRLQIIRAFMVIHRFIRRYRDNKKVRELVKAGEALGPPAQAWVTPFATTAPLPFLLTTRELLGPNSPLGSTTPPHHAMDEVDNSSDLRSIIVSQQEELIRLRRDLDELRATIRGSSPFGSMGGGDGTHK